MYFDFQTLNKQVIVSFQTRPGNFLIWQKFLERESPTLIACISVFEMNHLLLMETHEILIYLTT